jgi:hypothetical protein
MGFRPILLTLGAVGLSALALPALAAPPLASPSQLCEAAIVAAERAERLPERMMGAIALVETGRLDPTSGAPRPWPWTINAEGQGFFFASKQQAIEAVRALQARGVRSIDVGCMQVNLMHHPNAFASLDQAFDPAANATYAAHFLNDLHAQSNDWLRATGQYHSSTPELGAAYQTQVAAAWTQERQLADRMPMTTGAWPPATPAAASAMSAMASSGFHGVVPTMQHGTRPVGRDLAAYRAVPVQFAARAPPMLQRD